METTATKRPSEAERIGTLLARSAFYDGMSVVLRLPDERTVQWLAAKEHHRLIEIASLLTNREGGPLHRAVQRLVQALDSASMTEWREAHGRVFGHSVLGEAPPYELEYGEEHGHRQPQELGDIAAFYQAFGLRVSSQAHERADHIVTECEFLQFLLYKQACALDEGQRERVQLCESAARQFLADHLGRWGPAFCLRLARAAKPGLLRSVADAALAWLAEECTRMQVPIGSSDMPLRLPKEGEAVDCGSCLLASPPEGIPS